MKLKTARTPLGSLVAVAAIILAISIDYAPAQIESIKDAEKVLPTLETGNFSGVVTPSAASKISLPTLESTGQVKIDIAGTGETIGHVADLKIQNLTDQPLNCVFPPTLFESISGKNQPYVCPQSQTVAIEPHGTATVPMNGVCVNRNKPPVGKGVTGDLAMNDGDPNTPQNPATHMSKKDAGKLLRICTAKYKAAEKLERDGALKDIPYGDPQERIKIAEQWSTWCDPRISEITGAPPATKEDLRKVVYKQVEAKGPMTPETKKKVNQGINAIFEEGVKLTNKTAKGLEEPDQSAPPETTGGPSEEGNNPPPSTANVSDEREGVPGARGTPPQTQTAPSQPAGTPRPPTKYGPQLMVAPDAWKQQPAPPKTKEKDPAVQNWLDKRKAAKATNHTWWAAMVNYGEAVRKFIKKRQHWQNLKDSLTKEKDPKRKAEIQKEIVQLEIRLGKEFDETPEGKKLTQDLHEAGEADTKAHAEEKEAGKDIDEGVKKAEANEQDAQEIADEKSHD